jgi:maltooligosyltrehalose trehalohydrolase
VSHTDPQLVEAVRKGRREEFARFAWQGEIPDPQAEETFHRARLHWELREQGWHRVLCEFYGELLRLRRALPALARLDRRSLEAGALGGGKTVLLRRWTHDGEAVAVLHFDSSPAEVSIPLSRGLWRKELDSAESRWLGSGTAVPASVESEGNLTIAFNGRALVLFDKSS